MESRVLRFRNCYEELKKSIPIFTEAFVKYYGEDLRAEIEEKFSKAIFIGYQDPSYIKTSIRTLEHEKTEELLLPLISKLGVDITIKDLINSRTLDCPNGHPAKDLVDFYRQNKIGAERRKEEFIKEGYKEFKNTYPNATEEEYKEVFATKKLPASFETLSENRKTNILYYLNEKNIDNEYKEAFHKAEKLIKAIIPGATIKNFDEKKNTAEYYKLLILIEGYLSALEEYQKFKEEHKDLYAEEEKTRKRKQELDKKYHKEFIRENLDILPENIKEEVLTKLNSGIEYTIFGTYTDEIFGYLITSLSLMDAFKEEKNDLDKLNDWQREETIKKRIKYFKGFGIDHGNDYSKYLEDEEVKKVWPTPERIEAFYKSKEKYLNAFYREFYEQSPQHKRIREVIDRAGLLDKDDSFDATAYTSNLTCVNPNVVLKGDTYELLPLVLVNFNKLDSNYLDHFIVHELNHLFELTLQEVMGDSYTFICGWDDYTGEINQKEKKEADAFKQEDKRNYELFNEIINEFIAQEISEIMHQNGMYVFDDGENSKYRYTTSYDCTNFLVQNFFNEFKDVILASRRGNINLLFAEVGKENFEELNSLFHIFYESFPGTKIRSVLENKKNKVETEETKLYDELYARSEEILKKMRNYKARKKEESINK